MWITTLLGGEITHCGGDFDFILVASMTSYLLQRQKKRCSKIVAETVKFLVECEMVNVFGP